MSHFPSRGGMSKSFSCPVYHSPCSCCQSPIKRPCGGGSGSREIDFDALGVCGVVYVYLRMGVTYTTLRNALGAERWRCTVSLPLLCGQPTAVPGTLPSPKGRFSRSISGPTLSCLKSQRTRNFTTAVWVTENQRPGCFPPQNSGAFALGSQGYLHEGRGVCTHKNVPITHGIFSTMHGRREYDTTPTATSSTFAPRERSQVEPDLWPLVQGWTLE